MILLKRLTGRALLLALLLLPMLAGSAAASVSSASESGGTLTIQTTAGAAGVLGDVATYTDPRTNSPMVMYFLQDGGIITGPGCWDPVPQVGEVVVCDATGLNSIVIDSASVSNLCYEAYTNPLPLTVNYIYPIGQEGSSEFTEAPAGQVGCWNLVSYGGNPDPGFLPFPAGATTAAPFTLNDETPTPSALNLLHVNSGDGQATIYGGNAQGDFIVGSGGATIVAGSQPTTIDARNGVVDDIVCNSNRDIVQADVDDVITGTCGTLDTGGPPAASLAVTNAAPLTGQQVSFDASGSTDPARTITDYSWDFDGSAFNTDTGSTPTASHAYTTAGDYTASVRITDNAGQTSVKTMTIHVTPAPPAGTVGVSIDAGLVATSSPNVTLDFVWPAGATSAMISNDGGFGAAGSTETIALSATVPWTLESSGSDRLPETVYVRFLGAGSDNTSYTDDIVLDQTVPVIASAHLGRTPAARLAHTAAMPKVQLSASDQISGVTKVQFADSSSTVTDALVAPNTLGQYNVEQSISVGLAAPTSVRVQNAAGTWSGWSAITQTGCLVPQLTGKTLAQSKKLLARAHCTLGPVHKPKHARHVLRVKRQSPRPGATYAAGHRVSPTMG